jgi:hypothetical protein
MEEGKEDDRNRKAEVRKVKDLLTHPVKEA